VAAVASGNSLIQPPVPIQPPASAGRRSSPRRALPVPAIAAQRRRICHQVSSRPATKSAEPRTPTAAAPAM